MFWTNSWRIFQKNRGVNPISDEASERLRFPGELPGEPERVEKIMGGTAEDFLEGLANDLADYDVFGEFLDELLKKNPL